MNAIPHLFFANLQYSLSGSITLLLAFLAALLLPYRHDIRSQGGESARLLDFLRALSEGWYIILANVGLLFLLGTTPVGNDVLEYLVESRRGEMVVKDFNSGIRATFHLFVPIAVVQCSALVFALVSWITPQYGLEREALKRYSQNPFRLVNRLLGLSMFYVLALAMIQLAHPQESGVHCHWLFILLASLFLAVQVRDGKRAEQVYQPQTYLKRRTAQWLVVSLFAWIALAFSFTTPFEKGPAGLEYYSYATVFLLSGMLYWYGTLWTDMRWKIEKTRLDDPRPFDNHARDAFFQLLYKGLVALLIVAALWFTYLPNLQPVHPLAALLWGLAFITIILDTLHFGFMRAYLTRYFLVVWLFVAGFALSGLHFYYLLLPLIVVVVLLLSSLYHKPARVWVNRLAPLPLFFYVGLVVALFAENRKQSPGPGFFILTLLIWLIIVAWLAGIYFKRLGLFPQSRRRVPPEMKAYWSRGAYGLAAARRKVMSVLYGCGFFRTMLKYLDAKIDPSTSKLLVLLVSGFIVWQTFFGPADAPIVSACPDRYTDPQRLELEQGFHAWLAARQQEALTDTFPVFIVAGHGGGSRAAYWMAHSLMGLDSITGGRFRHHCLAISSISGSSPGTSATLAYWKAGETVGRPLSESLHFPRNVFRNNFITCGLAGNFFGDYLRKYGFPVVKNRNQRMQEEEAWCVQQGIMARGTMLRNNNMFDTRIGLDTNQTMYQPFLKFYYKSGELQTDLPFFFPNTCHVQSGKRGVISPFRAQTGRNDGFMLDALDILGIVAEQFPQGDKTVSFGGSDNVSELFPFFSASGSLEYQPTDTSITGKLLFVDGGYYENYGLTTALELFYSLKKIIESDTTGTLGCFKPHLLLIINDDSERVDSNKFKLSFSPEAGQFQAPLLALYNTPFGGHADQLRFQTRHRLEKKSLYYEITLNGEDAAVPLTRVLTKVNMDNMDRAWQNDKNAHVIKAIRRILAQ